MSDRQIIVVDCETSGLLTTDILVEVAWRNMTTGDGGRFVPVHNVADVLRLGDENALKINRYRERLQHARQDMVEREAGRLMTALAGNTLAGSNPTFDAGFVSRRYHAHPWHHRLLDLANYAAPLLGLGGHELPGLATVCGALGVTNPAPHTADGDVQATVDCFEILFGRLRSVAVEAMA